MQKSAPKTVALAVVIDEQAEQVYLQGRQLDEVKFGSDKIEAKRLVHYPDGKFTNLGVEFWLSINRVTGAFSYRGLPTTTDGTELSPAKAASLPLPPKLEGTCKPESS